MPSTSPQPYASLQRAEAQRRRELLDLTAYDVALDLAGDEATFGSVTTIRFRSGAGRTFLDLKPQALHSVVLDGRSLDVDDLERGRFPLDLGAGEHELVVAATMAFRHDGEGLHRSVDPADGQHYVYAMMFMDAAPSVFACFDQPDLKAPYTLHVRAPREWTVIGNAPAEQVEPGVWELETSPPLSTYFVTLVAGPYHVVTAEHAGIPLGLSARASLAADLDKDAEELFTLTRQSFDELHRLFGVPYAFGKYHQAFVPEFNAGAMENPGCVTFRDPLVFTSRVPRAMRVQRATTVAHEMAHQWFGDLVTPAWWDDLWLNESFAEYMGIRVVADVTEYAEAWADNAYDRRQWGLVADQGPSTHPVAGNGALDATAALQDFDGISYAKGCAVLRQVAASAGDEVFFAGVRDHFERHRFANATAADLFDSWERAGAGDLSTFTGAWLRTAGPDRLVVDRTAGLVRRETPSDQPADRSHRIRAAVAGPDGAWHDQVLEVDGPETLFDVGDRPVLLDPYLDSWAVTAPDPLTLAALPALLPGVSDPLLRAGVWSSVRSALHAAEVDPAAVLDLVVASLPVEDTADSARRTMAWVYGWVLPLQPDPSAASARVHSAAIAKLAVLAPESEEQLAAFRVAVATGPAASLRGWLDARDLPDGVPLDVDVRWRLLNRLAGLGEVELTELDEHLALEPTQIATVAHAGAHAALPTAEAKAWAWTRFTGEAAVPNYELGAAGRGLWRWGQDEVTAPYVDRYFDELPGTVAVRSGWTLGDATEDFFPRTVLTPYALERAEALLAGDLDPTIRRRLADQTDTLRRKLAVLARP